MGGNRDSELARGNRDCDLIGGNRDSELAAGNWDSELTILQLLLHSLRYSNKALTV